MPLLLADFIHIKVCKPNLRKTLDTTKIFRNRQIKPREEQNEKSREKRLFRCGYSVWHKRFGRA